MSLVSHVSPTPDSCGSGTFSICRYEHRCAGQAGTIDADFDFRAGDEARRAGAAVRLATRDVTAKELDLDPVGEDERTVADRVQGRLLCERNVVTDILILTT